jgi:hypothetical protein
MDENFKKLQDTQMIALFWPTIMNGLGYYFLTLPNVMKSFFHIN